MAGPNFIMIVTDDQGYGDLSCMGSTDFVTPNFDRMAREGVRFTDYYSNSPVCSPSRAALLTGRYPCHAGVREILPGSRTSKGMLPGTTTIAGALQKLGYYTGAIGKWHLGVSPQSSPNQFGFDHFFGFKAGCIDYYSHIFYWGMADGRFNPTHDLWLNDREVYDNGRYFTELVTEKSVEFIRQHSKEERPFLLYIGYNAPHYPMHAPKKYLDRFPTLSWDRKIMAAMISAVDDGIGEIRDELERDGILSNTCVVFQSDNGPSRESRNWLDGTPDPYYGGTTGGFKGHKYSLFEGGIRVPAMISWPERIPGRQVVREPVAAMDIFPTLLMAAGGNPEQYALDGRDITDVLIGHGRSPHDMIFWEMGPQTAVRRGQYKLVLNGRLVESEPPQDKVFLSDLSADPGESENLIGKCPDIAEELRRAAVRWREKIEAEWASRGE